MCILLFDSRVWFSDSLCYAMQVDFYLIYLAGKSRNKYMSRKQNIDQNDNTNNKEENGWWKFIVHALQQAQQEARNCN